MRIVKTSAIMVKGNKEGKNCDHQKCPENAYFSPVHNILASYQLPIHGQGHSGENTSDTDETILNTNIMDYLIY